MKTKITIVTPVHIGTGEDKMSFEYHLKDNTIFNYDLNDLFSCIPDQTLLNYKFLNNLRRSNDGSKRKELNETLKRYINYNNLNYQYSMRGDFDILPNENVAVQVKSLNVPYIPGSSLKGAIMNAIYYDFISLHLNEFCDYIRKYSNSNNKNIENFIIYYYSDYNDKMVKEFMHMFASYIMCSDAYFDKLVLVNTIRKKVCFDEKRQEMSLSNHECIDANQSKDGDCIKRDIKKMERLEEQYGDYKYCKDFIGYISNKQIIKVCRKYFHDMLEEEITMEKENGFYEEFGLDKALNDMFTNSIKNGFYMRIGKNTNHFFKTVSYLVKKNNPEFYARYFYQAFSPKDKPKKKKGAFPTPEKMPVTRVIYLDDKYAYYPGVIKIEFVK